MEIPVELGTQTACPEWPRVKKTDYGQVESLARLGKDPRAYQTTVQEFLTDEEGKLCGAVIARLRPERDPETGRTSMVPTGETFTYECWSCSQAGWGWGFHSDSPVTGGGQNNVPGHHI